jgi:hypothetical protein
MAAAMSVFVIRMGAPFAAASMATQRRRHDRVVDNTPESTLFSRLLVGATRIQ